MRAIAGERATSYEHITRLWAPHQAKVRGTVNSSTHTRWWGKTLPSQAAMAMSEGAPMTLTRSHQARSAPRAEAAGRIVVNSVHNAICDELVGRLEP